MNKKNSFNKLTPILLLIPSIVGQGVFVVLPFISVIKKSFYKSALGLFSGVNNYISVLENNSFWLATKNTLLFLVLSICMIQLLGMIFSYILFYLKDIEKKIKLICILPLAVPSASVTLFWYHSFEKSGFLNGILNNLNLPVIDWLNSKWGLLVLVLLFVWKNAGFIMLLWSIGLKTLPKPVYESAEMDGADKKQIFFYIVLPNMKATFYTTTIFSLANAFKIYREAYSLWGEYPSEHTYLLQHIFNNWFRDYDFDKLAAGSVMFSILVILLLIPLFRLNKQNGGYY